MIKVVDFYADWCGPCKIMAPIFEELEKDFSGRVEFEKVNVDADQARAQQFGVLSIPTFVMLKDSKEIDRTVGGRSKEAFKTWIESHLS
jgi:thioredoxin 1